MSFSLHNGCKVYVDIRRACLGFRYQRTVLRNLYTPSVCLSVRIPVTGVYLGSHKR